jgi:hypothetical protein
MKDETGARYGRLTVLSRFERNLKSRFRRASVKWLCRCDCGAETRVYGNKLRNGTVRNCLTCERAYAVMEKERGHDER